MSITTAEPLGTALRPGLPWAAVFGGATTATAITILLLALGSGLGLASVSPTGHHSNPGITTFTVYAAIWLIIVQWLSAFFGGYLAGRLRPGWGGAHRDEVMFRDTASGLVAWAVATIFVVGLASSGAASLLGAAGRAVTAVSSTATAVAEGGSGSADGVSEYLLDTLFRQTAPSPQANSVEAKAEAGRILLTGASGKLSPSDHAYLAQLVAARTGISAADAGKRVDQVVAAEQQAVAKAKQVADAARKAASKATIYLSFSMLIGAFIACVAAAIGGRQRDSF